MENLFENEYKMETKLYKEYVYNVLCKKTIIIGLIIMILWEDIMVDNEKIKSILTLYKQSKISEYVLERELGEYFGDLVRVQIEKESTTGKVSYCIFAIPELKQEGLRLTFVMDSNALKNIYKEEEFVVVCERMKDKNTKKGLAIS